MGNLFVALAELLERVVHYSADEMIIKMNSERKDLILQMPQFLIDHLPEAMYSKYGYLPSQNIGSAVSMFEGIKINPSSDLSITLFHKDYPLMNKDWMIVKIPLAPAYKVSGEWYTTYVMQLQECGYFKSIPSVVSN